MFDFDILAVVAMINRYPLNSFDSGDVRCLFRQGFEDAANEFARIVAFDPGRLASNKFTVWNTPVLFITGKWTGAATVCEYAL